MPFLYSNTSIQKLCLLIVFLLTCWVIPRSILSFSFYIHHTIIVGIQRLSDVRKNFTPSFLLIILIIWQKISLVKPIMSDLKGHVCLFQFYIILNNYNSLTNAFILKIILYEKLIQDLMSHHLISKFLCIVGYLFDK